MRAKKLEYIEFFSVEALSIEQMQALTGGMPALNQHHDIDDRYLIAFVGCFFVMFGISCYCLYTKKQVLKELQVMCTEREEEQKKYKEKINELRTQHEQLEIDSKSLLVSYANLDERIKATAESNASFFRKVEQQKERQDKLLIDLDNKQKVLEAKFNAIEKKVYITEKYFNNKVNDLNNGIQKQPLDTPDKNLENQINNELKSCQETKNATLKIDSGNAGNSFAERTNLAASSVLGSYEYGQKELKNVLQERICNGKPNEQALTLQDADQIKQINYNEVAKQPALTTREKENMKRVVSPEPYIDYRSFQGLSPQKIHIELKDFKKTKTEEVSPSIQTGSIDWDQTAQAVNDVNNTGDEEENKSRLELAMEYTVAFQLIGIDGGAALKELWNRGKDHTKPSISATQSTFSLTDNDPSNKINVLPYSKELTIEKYLLEKEYTFLRSISPKDGSKEGHKEYNQWLNNFHKQMDKLPTLLAKHVWAINELDSFLNPDEYEIYKELARTHELITNKSEGMKMEDYLKLKTQLVDEG